MADCTDLAFRLVAREHGMELAFLEMVSAHSLLRRNAKTLDMMKTVPEDRPLGAQLLGSDPAMMGEAAAMAEEMGFDLIDLNFGCPAPKVVRPGSGAALLRKPDLAEAIFRSVVRCVRRVPVTLKTRTGFDDPSGREALELARRAQDCGLAAVTVHGRTRAQRYAGHADWEAIGRVKRAVSIPVIGNGSVMRGPDAAALAAASGCDGVMLGRGSLGNPWLFKAAAAALDAEAPAEPPSFEERRRVLLRHMDLEFRFETERRALLNMRRIACWYFAGLPKVAAFRSAACVATTPARMRALIEGF
ncbi:MAG TPA: tRNA dihydrouridine synthase DusB [Elusimicrobia bacterium]|nr:tRNA dihydrouridine synthase DusB [Elusimicrobiota bacterium]